MIDEHLLKVVGAEPPILLQILCQVACYDHSSPIRHETSFVHFSHKSVYNRHSRHASSPPINDGHISLPIVVSAIVDAIAVKDFLAILHTPVPLVIAPKELINKDFQGLVLTMLFDILTDIPVDLTNGEAAIGQPR